MKIKVIGMNTCDKNHPEFKHQQEHAKQWVFTNQVGFQEQSVCLQAAAGTGGGQHQPHAGGWTAHPPLPSPWAGVQSLLPPRLSQTAHAATRKSNENAQSMSPHWMKDVMWNLLIGLLSNKSCFLIIPEDVLLLFWNTVQCDMPRVGWCFISASFCWTKA